MMNWHDRYIHQASWTRELRSYLFEKVGLASVHRVLEVGCGTGAILRDLSVIAPYGVDLAPASLLECRQHVPSALLTRGDALRLPYRDKAFEIAYCHFVLLWVHDPVQALREMKRVTKSSGFVIALAEPDYSARVDRPAELVPLGAWQSAALQRQGADVDLGSHLMDLFHEAGIPLIETGALRPPESHALSKADQCSEWQVLEADLAGSVPPAEIEKMKRMDVEAWERGDRVLNVPTYFAWGQV